MNRRTFFERSGRWASGLLLAFLGSFLILEREISTPTACGQEGICQQCLKNRHCEKPAAINYRKMDTENNP